MGFWRILGCHINIVPGVVVFGDRISFIFFACAREKNALGKCRIGPGGWVVFRLSGGGTQFFLSLTLSCLWQPHLPVDNAFFVIYSFFSFKARPSY